MKRNERDFSTQNVSDEAFCEQIRQRLDATPPSASIQSRLRRARQQALERAEAPGFDLFGFWRPVASFASAAALVATVAYLGQVETDNSMPLAEEDVEVLFSDDDLELYENLEFYAWLATAEQ